MLNRRELEIYGKELVSENLIDIPSIKLLEPSIVMNMPRSSRFEPKPTTSIKNPTWTDQWMALSGNSSGVYQCACCGKFVFADTSDPECITIARAYKGVGIIPNCKPDTLQIQGGHILLPRSIQNGPHLLAKMGTIHIVPLCKECNHPTKRFLQLRYGVTMTPEIRK